MTVYFVSRHQGAVEWAARNGIEGAVLVPHFNAEVVNTGDEVIGTLPVHIIADVNARGGVYHHLSMDIPPEARGKELTVEDMEKFHARLETFYVTRVSGQ